jgi:poly(hydroxyalkanoate) granule-associated protein
MARKSKSRKQSQHGSADSSRGASDSAQKIWLAGLGAFERAKTEGPRMFEMLVEQGRTMGARAVGAADEALKNLRQANYGGGRWDKLEQVFEDRVSRSLNRLGVLTKAEIDDLSRQVQELTETVRNLAPGGSRPAAMKKAGARTGGRKKPAAKARKARAKRATRA